MTPITLCCETCEEQYQIKPAKNKKRLLWLLTLSICTRCGTERNPEQCRRFDGQKRCKGCHLPESLLPRRKEKRGKETYEYVFVNNLCIPCYWNEKRVVSIKTQKAYDKSIPA